MRQPLILNYFYLLPEKEPECDDATWANACQQGLHKFKRAIEARYNEATLERLLSSSQVQVRQAAVLALGMVGTMYVNMPLASCLHDDDPTVREWAADALWSIWFRADTPENNQELQRLIHIEVNAANAPAILAGFETLIRRSTRFAEAYNQRAIVYYRLGDYPRAANDCEKVLRLNPYHFGAANGLAQAFMKQRKFRAALRSYRRANRINPDLAGVPQVIENLERMLGEEGKRGS